MGGGRAKVATDEEAGEGGEAGPAQGLLADRKCRDVLFLVVFLAYMCGMLAVAALSFTKGNYALLLYGRDSYGNVCGAKNDYRGTGGPDFREMKKLYYLDPTDFTSPVGLAYGKKVCLGKCPQGPAETCALTDLPCQSDAQFVCPYYATNPDLHGTIAGMADWSTAYYSKLPTSTSDKCSSLTSEASSWSLSSSLPGSMSNVLSSPSLFSCGDVWQTTSNIPSMGPCYPNYLNTTDIANKCIPQIPQEAVAGVLGDTDLAGGNALANGTASPDLQEGFDRDKLQRYVGDISRGWLLILVAGVFGSIILSLFAMTLIRYFAGVVAWGLVVVVDLLFILAALLTLLKGGVLDVAALQSTEVGASIDTAALPIGFDPAGDEVETWKYASYVMSGFAGLTLIFTLLMIPKIKVAVACIKVASQAVGSMPSILMFPMFPFLVTFVFLAYWVVVTAFLWSAGDTVAVYLSNEGESVFEPSLERTVYTQADSSGKFWDCPNESNCLYETQWDEFLQYSLIYHVFGGLWVMQFIVAYGQVVIAGAISQFYWLGGDKAEMPRAPVLSFMYRAIRYHAGSIALGSFIIAVVQFIRLVLEYIDHKTQQLQEKHEFLKYIMYLLKYLMWYLEKVLKFINKNAFIVVAVKGTGYCSSAYTAIKLILGNLARIAAVNTLAGILTFLGKLSVTAGCFFLGMAMAQLPQYTDPSQDTYLLSPLLPSLLCAAVASIVGSLFFNVFDMAIDTIFLSFCEDCEENGGKAQHAPALLIEAIGMRKKNKEATVKAKGEDEE